MLYLFADLVKYSWMCPYVRHLCNLGIAVLSSLWLFAAILIDCKRRFLLGSRRSDGRQQPRNALVKVCIGATRNVVAHQR